MKNVYDIYINQFVNIVKHSQQLETVYFKGTGVTKEMTSHIMTQLAIKWLILLDCDITQDIAEVFVEALKKGDHSFL